MGELFAEIAHEIAVDPIKYIGEVIQFLLLAGIIYFVAIGLGKRRGMLVKMLDTRRERVAGALERARTADATLEEARGRATATAAAAKQEAAAIVRTARSTARTEKAAMLKAAQAEADAAREHASKVLERELAEMYIESRDRLVDLVAQATRSVLNEGLSIAEQRELVQHAVLDGVAHIEGDPVTAAGEVRA